MKKQVRIFCLCASFFNHRRTENILVLKRRRSITPTYCTSWLHVGNWFWLVLPVIKQLISRIDRGTKINRMKSWTSKRAPSRNYFDGIASFVAFRILLKQRVPNAKEKKKLADHGRVVTKGSLTIPVTAKKSVNNTLQHVKTAHCSESMLGCIVIFISHVVTHGVFQRIFFWYWKFRLIMTAAQVVLLWSNNLHLGFISLSRTKFSLNHTIC